MKIGFHLGSISDPIFIQNQIISLLNKNVKIYLFGKKIKKNRYKIYEKANFFIAPKNNLFYLSFIIYNFLLLCVFKPKVFLTIIKYSKNISKKSFIEKLDWWGTILPVLNNLPDIFHIQWAKSIDRWFFLKRLFNVKIVLSLRGTHINCSPIADKQLESLYKTLFPSIDQFHSVSNSLALNAIKYGADKNKIKVIRSPINFTSIQVIKKKWKIGKKIKLISVGRYHWTKGYQYALSAIHKLKSKQFEIMYTIITKDNPSEEVLYQIVDQGLENNIKLKSVETQDEIFIEMVKSDCLILPSVEEGIANVVLESMAVGLPVISSDCGGMTELIINNVNGLLFKNRDYSNLAETLEYFIKMPNVDKEKIIQNAKISILKKNNLDEIGLQMKNLYKSIF